MLSVAGLVLCSDVHAQGYPQFRGDARSAIIGYGVTLGLDQARRGASYIYRNPPPTYYTNRRNMGTMSTTTPQYMVPMPGIRMWGPRR